jgi:tripartite-type tricarboxylate transporter receptor subunit TctC
MAIDRLSACRRTASAPAKASSIRYQTADETIITRVRRIAPAREGIMSRMKAFRKIVVCVGALSAALTGQVSAQEYPTRPVRVIVGFPPGGPTDILARLMGQWLSDRLGQPFIIENRPSAGGNIATQAVVNSAPDGATLLLLTHANAINATLYEKLAFNPLTDIVPVAGLAQVPNVVEVHPSLPVKTIAELIAYAKANPGTINYASAGNGTSPHLATELFKAMTGTNMVHVPYRGSGPALIDLLAGQVQLMFDSIPSSLQHIRAGKLRALAVTSAQRSDALPDVPTVADTLPGYEFVGWFGVGAPKGTPAEIVEKLNREINAGLADATMTRRFADLGATPQSVSPAQYSAFVAAETEKFAKAVKFSGARAE